MIPPKREPIKIPLIPACALKYLIKNVLGKITCKALTSAKAKIIRGSAVTRLVAPIFKADMVLSGIVNKI